MRALITLETQHRHGTPPSIRIEDYIAWGGYEVPPEATEDSSSRPALSRLMRVPTFAVKHQTRYETRRGRGSLSAPARAKLAHHLSEEVRTAQQDRVFAVQIRPYPLK